MNEMRADLAYLLRQLRSAGDKGAPAPAPPVGRPMEPAEFLDTLIRLDRERRASEALLRKAKDDLKAVNDELPRWQALLDAWPVSQEPTVDHAAEAALDEAEAPAEAVGSR